jgi:hypothetical protein
LRVDFGSREEHAKHPLRTQLERQVRQRAQQEVGREAKGRSDAAGARSMSLSTRAGACSAKLIASQPPNDDPTKLTRGMPSPSSTPESQPAQSLGSLRSRVC